MSAFTQLELAALHSAFSEAPELASQLEQQLSVATVTERENTGVGFFTTISVPSTAVAIERSEPLSGETHARIPVLSMGWASSCSWRAVVSARSKVSPMETKARLHSTSRVRSLKS